MGFMTGRSTHPFIFIRNGEVSIRISTDFFRSLMRISPEILFDGEIAFLAELLRNDEDDFDNSENNIIPLVEGSEKMHRRAELYGDLLFSTMYNPGKSVDDIYSPQEIFDNFGRIEKNIVNAMFRLWEEKYLLDNVYMKSLTPGPKSSLQANRVSYCTYSIDTAKLGNIILDHSPLVMQKQLTSRPEILSETLQQLRWFARRQIPDWKEVELLADFFVDMDGNTLSQQTTILILSIPCHLNDFVTDSEVSSEQLYRLRRLKRIFPPPNPQWQSDFLKRMEDS